jgi:hypothetical protein
VYDDDPVLFVAGAGAAGLPFTGINIYPYLLAGLVAIMVGVLALRFSAALARRAP